MKVKIIGAGSIGNHLAHAARRMDWEVTVVDFDLRALKRMREEIYPTRYGAWDPTITLVESKDEPRGGFDIIMIGTPPNVRMELALEALAEKPRLLQLEKPLCAPDMGGFLDFYDKATRQQHETSVILGYDHAISSSIALVTRLLQTGGIGGVKTIDVEFREHWGGIFKAHPWLSGPEDSYLGHRSRGGGASGEHSHALHLWQYLASISGFGEWIHCSYALDMVQVPHGEYDSIASFSFLTDRHKVGRVVQDVVTYPSRKWARVQGATGFIEWQCESPQLDTVRWSVAGGLSEEQFSKNRSDDFFREMMHIEQILKGNIDPKKSPVSLTSGVRVMYVLSAVYRDGGAVGSVQI